MAAILRHNNKLTSGMCLLGFNDPLHLVSSFVFNQAACLFHPTKPYQGINFLYQRFLTAAYLDATIDYRHTSMTPQNYFRAGFQKHFSPGAIRGTLARYYYLHDWDPVRDRFAFTLTK